MAGNMTLFNVQLYTEGWIRKPVNVYNFTVLLGAYAKLRKATTYIMPVRKEQLG